ncbi:MAG: DUF4239 domain-containing protein [Planctomycetota bacterium]
MSDFLDSLRAMIGLTDTGFCILLTLIACLMTLLIGRVVIRKLPFAELVESGEAFGSYCNIIGVLYAIVLGYVLVNVYESYSTANEKVEAEASLVIDLLRDAEGLPMAQALIFRKATMEYVDSVIDEEWQFMIDNRDFHPTTFEKFATLYHLARLVKCDSDEQRLFLGEIISRLNELSSVRRERVQVSSSRVPDILWGMLIGVGIVTFVIAFFFPVENPKIRLFLLCCTASVMTFTTMLIYELDRPYSGSLGIKPDSMEKVRKVVNEHGLKFKLDMNPDMQSVRERFMKKAAEKAIEPNQ